MTKYSHKKRIRQKSSVKIKNIEIENQICFIVGYNEKSDIYSVGMVVCELANGAEPFAGVSTTLMLIEKVRGCSPQLLDCTTLSMEHTDMHGNKFLHILILHCRNKF